jgi:hypothetical protein
MVRTDRAKIDIEEVLLSFRVWVQGSLRQSLSNAVVITKTDPKTLKNPFLIFVVPRALDHVVENSVVNTVQAWELLAAYLKKHKKRRLNSNDKHFRHLKRIRNKLVAHKVENMIATRRHESWYKRTYGSYETVLALVENVANAIANRIEELETRGILRPRSMSMRHVPEVTVESVQQLFDALRKHGID